MKEFQDDKAAYTLTKQNPIPIYNFTEPDMPI